MSESVRLLVSALAAALPGMISVSTTKDEFTDTDQPAWPPLDITVARAYGPSNFGFSLGLLRDVMRLRPTVVHVHGLWMFHCFVALVWSLVSGGGVVITVHGMLEPWILERSPRLKWLVRKLFQDWLIARADCLQLLTEKERADVLKVYPNAKTKIIPNFVPATCLPEPLEMESQSSRRQVFLFLGRLHEKKGCRELLQAWDAVSSEDATFRARFALVFCGWSDGLDGFQDEIDDVARRHENVSYVGPRYGKEKAQLLAEAAFFILPSKSEGLPMTVLEAWAAGLVVMMTAQCNLPIGFIRRAALETGTGVGKIAESLRCASALSEQERRALAERGRRVVGEFYSQAVVTRAMLDLYEGVISDKQIRKGLIQVEEADDVARRG